jgi:hypothetical protein
MVGSNGEAEAMFWRSRTTQSVADVARSQRRSPGQVATWSRAGLENSRWA